MGSPNLGTDPNTGQAQNSVGQLWQGITGKSGPTAPRLPQGFEWLGPVLKQVGTGAAGQINYGNTNAARDAGVVGTQGSLGIASGIDNGAVAGGFNNAVANNNVGMQTGYLPDVNQIDSLLRPTLNRSFDQGAAAIREQNALTGNLSSSGASQQVTDFRSQLENQLGSNVAGVYSNAIPASIAARTAATGLGAGLPGTLQGGLYSPITEQGFAGSQFPLTALGTATGSANSAPFYARQGSSGNGAVGSILGAYAGKGSGGAATGGKG